LGEGIDGPGEDLLRRLASEGLIDLDELVGSEERLARGVGRGSARAAAGVGRGRHV
jgi:hypothetical protein